MRLCSFSLPLQVDGVRGENGHRHPMPESISPGVSCTLQSSSAAQVSGRAPSADDNDDSVLLRWSLQKRGHKKRDAHPLLYMCISVT